MQIRIFGIFFLSVLFLSKAFSSPPKDWDYLSADEISSIISSGFKSGGCTYNLNNFKTTNVKVDAVSLEVHADSADPDALRPATLTVGERNFPAMSKMGQLIIYDDQKKQKPVLSIMQRACEILIYYYSYHQEPNANNKLKSVSVFKNNSSQVFRVYKINDPIKPLGEIYTHSELNDLRPSRLKDKAIIALLDTGVDYNHPAIAFAIERPKDRIREREKITEELESLRESIPYSAHCILHPMDCLERLRHLEKMIVYNNTKIQHENYRLYDFVDYDVLPDDFTLINGFPQDHGTHVAGILVKNKDVRILPLRVIGNSNHISIFDSLMNSGARVVNMSYGWNLPFTYVDQIQSLPSILFVKSAGNDGINIEDTNMRASKDIKNLILVANLNAKKTALTQDSNFGSQLVHIAAVGQNVKSSVPGFLYDKYSGTSMAAPQVSRAAARMLNENPHLTPGQIKEIILSTGDKIPTLTNKVECGCALNEEKAIQAAKTFRAH